MKTSEFKQILKRYPDAELAFVLPNGARIPVHAHITEVGRFEKTFLDCGGKLRRTVATNLQSWVADDKDHRLSAGKLVAIIEEAAPLLGTDDPAVQIEYQDGWISQFPVVNAEAKAGVLTFHLESKNTDCLARDVCIPEAAEAVAASGCCGTTGCC